MDRYDVTALAAMLGAVAWVAAIGLFLAIYLLD